MCLFINAVFSAIKVFQERGGGDLLVLLFNNERNFALNFREDGGVTSRSLKSSQPFGDTWVSLLLGVETEKPWGSPGPGKKTVNKY